MVKSGDGTRLACSVTGSGPPLVLVHGSNSDREQWAFVAPVLAEQHTVWAFDRRGHGESDVGDAGYDLAAEGADVRAVVEAAGHDAHLVGHSFGAATSLEAVAAGLRPATLTLYEPPIHGGAVDLDPVLALLRAGDREGALDAFMPIGGISADEVAMMRSIPEVWNRFLDNVAGLERETSALIRVPWDPQRFAGVDVPTLLLRGEFTDSPIFGEPEDLLTAFPHADEHRFAGQRHIAFAVDPHGFADTLLRFTTAR